MTSAMLPFVPACAGKDTGEEFRIERAGRSKSRELTATESKRHTCCAYHNI